MKRCLAIYLAIYFLLSGCIVCARAQEPAQRSSAKSIYAGLSPRAAKAEFERQVVAVRIEQRAAQQQARDAVEQLGKNPQLDARTRERLSQLALLLAETSDFGRALELVSSEQSRIEKPARQSLEQVLRVMAQPMTAYQQIKRDYQPIAGQALSERWSHLSLEEKRIELSDYLALADERPVWLLRQSPINPVDLIPKSAMPAINQYDAEKQTLIQGAVRELKPLIDTAAQSARDMADSTALSDKQRTAAARVAEVLEAPYGRGLRGVMACPLSEDLPESLYAKVATLLHEFSQQQQRLRPVHARLLKDLHTRLESGQDNRLKQLRFAEQMPIDLHLAAVTHLVQPLRVVARRSSRADYFEDAKLMDLRFVNSKIQYHVEYLVDGWSKWIDFEQVSLVEMRGSGDGRLDSPAPPQGPGRRVNAQTDLRSGQLFAYRASQWRPVQYVDESALGVLLRWHGQAEPVEFPMPRKHLRIEAAHSP